MFYGFRNWRRNAFDGPAVPENKTPPTIAAIDGAYCVRAEKGFGLCRPTSNPTEVAVLLAHIALIAL
jgi:hypothetical protein